MAQSHGGVHLRHRADDTHKEGDHQQNDQGQEVGNIFHAHLPKFRQHLAHLREIGDDGHRGQSHNAADDGDHHGADELGGHQLPGLHGNGEHQVALILQQALVEPGNDDDGGHHHHRHDEQHIHHTQQRGEDAHAAPLGQRGAGDEPIDPGHHQQHPPQGQENLEHGFEVIFQQFSQHSSHLPEDWPGTCPGTRRPRSCPPGPGCRLRPRGPTPGPAGGTPPRPAPAPRLQ